MLQTFKDKKVLKIRDFGQGFFFFGVFFPQFCPVGGLAIIHKE
jgi:hypothetical protein